MPDHGPALAVHIRASAAQLADACTACGACFQACPMVERTEALTGADPTAVMAGIRDILRERPGIEHAITFAAACVRSGVCTDACPEHIDAAFLMRLASLRVRGVLGDPPRVSKPHDARWSARVKAFARLTLSPQQQEEWL